MSPDLPLDTTFMQLALTQAQRAAALGEVPIGAVIACDDEIISKSYNQVESLKDATAHAEILAIKLASAALGKWRLEDCTLYITLEPCPMCLGAIRLARLKRVVIGAVDSRMGALTTFIDPKSDSRLGPLPEIVSGVLELECAAELKNFFKQLRK